MFLVLLPWLVCLAPVAQPPVQAGPGFDFTPIKAPLDRLAAAVDRALTNVESVKTKTLQAINWTAIGASILLTMLLMHTFHLHGLAASKTNLIQENRQR